MAIKGITALILIFLNSTVWAHGTQGLYFNGRWDEACNKCWGTPRTLSSFHCKPADCAVQGYYHCKVQNPPLAADDDNRLIALIRAGECQYVPHAAFNAGEAAYVQSVKQCTQILDTLAGRFVIESDQREAKKHKLDFYFTRFKATLLSSAAAQFKLARDYDIGQGTKQDRLQATLLYKQAARKGFSLAQYALAARYAYGISMPRDKEKAIWWLNQALKNQQPFKGTDRKAQSLVGPCALKLLERLTLV